MIKLKMTCILIIVVTLLLPGCGTSDGEKIAEPTAGQIPVNAEFGRKDYQALRLG